MKNLKKRIEKLQDKGLLLLESPMYPFVYLFLQHTLKTEQGRKKLYLQTKGFFPLRRLFFYVLDKLFEKECNHFKNPSYAGYAGYILDLKYALAHSYFNKKTYQNNYKYSFDYLHSILKSEKVEDVTIIDFGCGAGVMTRMIKERFAKARVVGLDIRKETMEYNTILYTDISWDLVTSLDVYKSKSPHHKTILICNGVINFMTFEELQSLLSKKIDYFVWFYYTSYQDPSMEYKRNEDVLLVKHNDVDYNMPKILERHQYSFDFTLVPIEEGVGNFIHGMSRYHGAM